jgi:3'(2'), 5'-bisphosphate nucleotidase
MLLDDMAHVRDWTPISTRRSPSPPVAVASRSHLTQPTKEALTIAGVREYRSIGSSLKFCLLAEGAADFYPRLGRTNEWDTAAGDAVLRAAGGAVVTLDGTRLRYGRFFESSRREFGNPDFVAVGDPELLDRLDLSALASTKAA